MSDLLARLLREKPYLIADGAMGTSLFALGLETGDSPEPWNDTHPDRVAAVHQGFVDAGADIVLTNSFGGSRHRLKLHRAEDRVGELNETAARIACEVARTAGRDIVVAGDIGPTGELFEPLGPLTRSEGEDAFGEQARALAAGGADVIWIETMSSPEELAAAVAGAAPTGLPIVCTMTFDTAGRTMMGVTPEEAAAFCRGLDPAPIAYGANCGNGPAELVNAVVGLGRAAGPDDVLVAKGNCGIPDYVDGAIRYSGTPEIMARYAHMARDAGARIIGACCGSTPEHLGAMVAALEDYKPEPAPGVGEIEANLGPLASPAARRGGGRAAPQHRRRRRGR
ncbi:MAG: betaine--homocysteine S-methyltransferase [Alphaproteobacteria bacterium]